MFAWLVLQSKSIVTRTSYKSIIIVYLPQSAHKTQNMWVVRPTEPEASERAKQPVLYRLFYTWVTPHSNPNCLSITKTHQLNQVPYGPKFTFVFKRCKNVVGSKAYVAWVRFPWTMDPRYPKSHNMNSFIFWTNKPIPTSSNVEKHQIWWQMHNSPFRISSQCKQFFKHLSSCRLHHYHLWLIHKWSPLLDTCFFIPLQPSFSLETRQNLEDNDKIVDINELTVEYIWGLKCPKIILIATEVELVSALMQHYHIHAMLKHNVLCHHPAR